MECRADRATVQASIAQQKSLRMLDQMLSTGQPATEHLTQSKLSDEEDDWCRSRQRC